MGGMSYSAGDSSRSERIVNIEIESKMITKQTGRKRRKRHT